MKKSLLRGVPFKNCLWPQINVFNANFQTDRLEKKSFNKETFPSYSTVVGGGDLKKIATKQSVFLRYSYPPILVLKIETTLPIREQSLTYSTVL